MADSQAHTRSVRASSSMANRSASGSAEAARWMARAIALARRGAFTTDPNPRVGCVLVRDGVMVGEGWHAWAGQPHAEAEALAAAGLAARGATAYVSLEPCCHQGRTGPCTEALVRAGVVRVVAAIEDPNPVVSGRGLADLQAGGVAVECGLLEEEARALNRGYLQRLRRGRPLVRLKLAASLDGRTAMASGESRWITGPAARRDAHGLRARSSALVTGVGTVLADDPGLDVRLADLPPGRPYPASPLGSGGSRVRQPLRVVVDSHLRTSPQARTLTRPGPVLVVAGVQAPARRRSALEACGAEVALLGGRGARVDLEALLGELAAREANEVLVECGPILAGAFLDAALVDEVVLYLAPSFLGDDSRPLVHLPGLARLRDRRDLKITGVRAVGGDLRLTLVPERS